MTSSLENSCARKKKLLILDLDGTLVNSEIGGDSDQSEEVDFYFKTERFQYFVRLRPHACEFIERVSMYFDLAVWSAGSKQYVEGIVAYLFDGIPLRFVYSWRDCAISFPIPFLTTHCLLEKPLKKVVENGFSTWKDVLLVDDTPMVYRFNEENAIPISSWNGLNQEDQALDNLSWFLLKLATVDDVRCIDKTNWEREVYSN